MSSTPRQTTPDDQRIADRVKAARVAAGWSQERLAGVLGIPFQQVQKYEGGANRIAAGRLHDIATALGVSVASFFPPEGETRAADMPKLRRSELAVLRQLRNLPPNVRRSIDSLIRDMTDNTSTTPRTTDAAAS
jgi:transcriptional regulator with XRE-family HTH domain